MSDIRQHFAQFHLDEIGDFTFSTVVVGVSTLPCCTIIQGVPLEMLPDASVYGIEVPVDQHISVTKEAALFLIERLQRWLQDQEANSKQTILPLEASEVTP